MADYVKLKGTAAKVGVMMALLALLAGIAETTGPGPAKAAMMPAAAMPQPNAQGAQVPKGKIPLRLKGLSSELRRDFRTIGAALFGLDSRLEEEEGIFYYFTHTTAKHFLTTSGASKKYLAISGTARNANELRGLSPSAFVQGDGGLVSGAATLSGVTKPQKLLSTPGIEVDVATNGDGFPSLTIKNSTGLLIPAIQDQGGTDGGVTLQSGANPLTLSLQNGIDQFRLQTFPVGSFNRVVTLIISISFNSAQGSSSFAGQLLDGGT